jgi:2-deoxy-D-gluconate 3-dehydrogenase
MQAIDEHKMKETILNKFDMTGKTALITGAGGLLGKQFALTLGQAGANLVLADLNLDLARANANELQKEGYQALAVRVDVTNPDSCQEMVEVAQKNFGGLDVLINSAALDPKFDATNLSKQGANAFEEYSLDAWRQALDVNLTGTFLASQASAKAMLQQGRGVIINICSTYGLVGPDQRLYERPDGSKSFKPVYYSVTKAGILGFTRYLAAYYAGKNIRVNALTPGGVYNDHDGVFTQQYSARTILGRMANLDEMSGAMLFLCSDASSYMTGSNLVVDGGWTAW